MNEQKSERQLKTDSWFKLFGFTATVAGSGFLAGHLATMCPTPGLRAALYPWYMHALWVAITLFAAFLFTALGFHLAETETRKASQ